MPNNELVNDLKRQIESGDVVFVIGSGISRYATEDAPCASWRGLLRHGLDYAQQIQRISNEAAAITRQQIEVNGDEIEMLLGAAQTISAKLGAPEGGDFRAWLEKSIGGLTATKRDVIELLAGLGGTLATTNYDGLLTDVTGRKPVTWRDGTGVEQVLRRYRDRIIHLHGHYDEPASIILDWRSYERLNGSRYAEAMLPAIRTFRTMVFLGCGGDGLKDPHFEMFFRWASDAFSRSTFRHYVLCPDDEFSTMKQKRTELYPIAYGENYTYLPKFLESLRV